MSVAIAVMSKTPGLSPVKTRLAAGIGGAAAVRLHRMCAAATASVVAQAARSGQACAYWAIAETGAAAAAAWPAMPAAGFTLVHQCAGQLGERMARLHRELLARHGAAILLGIDSPQMEAAQLLQAVDWLHSQAPRLAPRLALGPAEDGGFWLFGANREIPLQDWSTVEYSTPRTGAAFAAMIAPHGALLTLPRLCDADTLDDLPRLRAGLQGLAAPTAPQQTLLRWLEQRAA